MTTNSSLSRGTASLATRQEQRHDCPERRNHNFPTQTPFKADLQGFVELQYLSEKNTSIGQDGERIKIIDPTSTASRLPIWRHRLLFAERSLGLCYQRAYYYKGALSGPTQQNKTFPVVFRGAGRQGPPGCSHGQGLIPQVT